MQSLVNGTCTHKSKYLHPTQARGLSIPLNSLLQFIYFYFVLQFICLPIKDLILASNEFKGIDNPLARVGCKYLLLCVHVLFTRVCVFSFWFDKPWFSLR